MTKFSGTVYPNGEFTIGVVPRRLKPADILPVKAKLSEEEELRAYALHEHGLEPALAVFGGEAPLGSSSLPISAMRSRKGLNGMTSAARRKIRNDCYLIEKEFGRGNCGFMTLTLPEMNLEDWAAVCHDWGKLVNNFTKRVKRRLTARGIKPYIVYVTEFQMKRYEKTGRAYPHLHACYPAKPNRTYDWYISASELRDIWREVIQSRCLSSYSFDASIDCVVVKKGLGAYLSKYLSKGAGDIKRVVESGIPLGCIGHWWGHTSEVRAAVAALCCSCPNLIVRLWREAESLRERGAVKWLKYISIETHLAGRRIIGCCGLLDGPSKEMLLSEYPRGKTKWT